MELNDWILALHLLSAFALVGSLTIFSILIVAGWREERPGPILSFLRISLVANTLVIVGVLGTIVFGVWLALSVDAYDIWDGWIIASLVLWAVGSELGRRAGEIYAPIADRARELATSSPDTPNAELGAMMRSSRALWYHVGSSAAILVILVLMIWKPGA